MPERRAEVSGKRRRDAAATRQAILEAATRRFATQGYQRAGVREIAADVGVNASLVNRYFVSKEKLFAEVIKSALDIKHLLQGRHGDLADHLARALVYGRDEWRDRGYTPLMLLLHSATEPGAVKLFRRDLNNTAIPLLAEQIGGDEAAIRAAMVMAQLTGFAIMHHVHRPKAFADARGEELVALLSRTLAACIGSGRRGVSADPEDTGPRHSSPCS
jgi:AcrR family transcriptional regulator